MPISALVVTMSRDEDHRRRALERLSEDPRLTPGELKDIQLPLVVETDTVGESIEFVHDELPSMEGVVFVHVISVDFSDLDSRDEKLPRRNKQSTRRGAS